MKRENSSKQFILFNSKYSLKKNYKYFTTVFIVGLFALTTLISVGFAALNQNLNIAGALDYEKLNVAAINLSYDGTNSGVGCTTAQCMIDCLANESFCPPAPDGEVIQFSYEGNTYQFEAGMTWAAWLDTEYNLDGFDSSGNYVLDLNGNFITKDGNNREQVTNIITATEYYIHR